MKINMADLIYALSYALDSVEHELVGSTTYHSKRVAYLSAEMGRAFNLDDHELVDLACAAALHDNALTEYVKAEYLHGIDVKRNPEAINLGDHCAMGERNISQTPFYPRVVGAIKYHHEDADGSGPFGLRSEETPLYGQIIHLADRIDVLFDFSFLSPAKYEQILNYVRSSTDTCFAEPVANAFLNRFEYDSLLNIQGERIDMVLQSSLPDSSRTYTNEQIEGLATIFARITDYKSLFTRKHSEGIAKKAREMGCFYGYDDDTCTKLYLSGALHDIGKLVVDRDVLEKPDKLTEEEYEHVQNHAWYSYNILRKINGFEDVAQWASLHHEKLDGTGYPFGMKENELNKMERLMGVIDIYQALIEDRPYKSGFSHERSLQILRDMASKGKIDAAIVEDVNSCFG